MQVFSAWIVTGYLESLLSEISGLSPAGSDWEGPVNTDDTELGCKVVLMRPVQLRTVCC